jgi:ribonuclease HI/probable phosphoglycerate mutase
LTRPKTLSRDAVLTRLSERLDDAFLAELFPGEDPEQLRHLVAGTFVQLPKKPVLKETTPAVAAAGCFQLFTDGASRGNPGEAGAGAVLFSPAGEELLACSKYLGTCTNNVAEYKALILGLDEALQLGCRELAIALDSQLIVRQIQGQYKVKNETLLPLFQEVRKRLARLEKWTIRHVPRAENSRADQLANRGIDEQ